MDRALHLLERIGVVRRAARRADAVAAGLSTAQLDALAYLAECNRFSNSPAAVAEYLDATRGTVSQTLRTLERKHLIERVADPRDGRVHHLRPTAAGRRVLEDGPEDPFPRALAALGADRAVLEGLLARVLAEAQRLRGRRPFGRCFECRHLRGTPDARRCGLTDEPLSARDTTLLCIEFAERETAARE
ncbi:MAG TPA: MarR family transcriptional regulator [Miltoncostaeaceae bacterium]|nr:MarR family transcriptional regulator [Miltoncostaeaceae bacterium]